MAKLPCSLESRVFTLKSTGETMSYNQVRQYLMENPDIWLGAKEGKEVAMPTSNTLKDVESTAKALEGVNQNDLPLARDTASNIVKEYEQAQKEVKRLNEEKSSLTDAEKDAIVKKSGYVKSNKYPGYYEFSTGASVKRKTKQEIIDAYYDKKIKAVKKDAPNEKVLELYRNQDRAYSTPQKISEAYHKAKKDGTNPELIKAVEELLGGKEVAMPKAAEVQVEQYKPITKKNIEIGKFSKDEALDYEEDEKELDSGRMSTYISSMTVDVMDEDGNSIGNLIRLKDEDGIATYQATDIDGNELTLDEFDTKDEAIQALLDAHNKQAEKEFNKEQKRLAKEREKQAAKKQPSTMPGNTNADIANRIRNKKQKGALSAIDFGISVTIYNGALDFMASQVEKGTKLGNAIANTIKWIDEKMAGAKWNKGAFGKYMNDTYSVTLPNGREVEVVRDDSKETAEVINGWYSELEQKILDSKEDRLPAATWAKRLKSKENEDVWTGVRGFLESKKPSEQVSKKELRDWMKDNRVEISEVVKSADNDISDWSQIRQETKFSQYQLEGDKENYKEVLVTLPEKKSQVTYSVKQDNLYFNVVNDSDDSVVQSYDNREDAQKFADYLKKDNEGILESFEGQNFQSSHFDEPNILVHLRMNTRTDANGNKVLFLEEVQSDWGQKGKKEGFSPIGDFDKSKIKIVKKDERFSVRTVYYDGKEIGNIYPQNDKDAMDKATQVASSYYDNQTAIRIPSAPFVTDTNSWTKLGLKVALREAVKQGADKIAWTTGEQQNDRYDLSKQVDEIRAKKNEDGTYKINAAKDGNNVFTENAVEANKLSDIVGKELAQKIINDKSNEGKFAQYKGQDLQIGGKGMKGFYGSPSEGNLGIVGNVAKSLFKQEPGTVEINNSTQASIDITPEMRESVEKGLPLFGTKLSPEQELKNAFDKWKQETGKMGIAPNWEKQAEADIKLFKALAEYLRKKLAQGAFSFEQFIKDLGKTNVENIDKDKELWRKFYNDAVAGTEKKEAPKAPSATPPTEKKPVRELPEGEEGETEKPVLGRAFKGTTDEALAEKLAKMGLYRKPASLEEAFKLGEQTVALLGVDKAIELGSKGEVSNGLVRMGIFKAVLANLKNQRDNLVVKEGTEGQEEYIKALDEINDKRAEAMAAFSPSLTSAGQVLRGFQDIIRDEEFEFDYTSRRTKFKDLFGEEAYTKEVDERFKEYDIKLKEAAQKRKELEDKIAELEAQSVVDDINNQTQEEKKEKKPTSFFKQAAERVRKLKLSRPGIFSSATPASLAWDATIEAVATVLDASGTLENAIKAGVQKLKETEWYKSLNPSKQSQAEKEFSETIKDTYILKATIDDDGVIQVPTGLLRSYVTSGVNDVQAIIDDMLSYLKQADSEITASDVRTAILEAGKKEAPTQNQITQSVNDLKSMIRMLGQLEKIRAGERITKNEGKKRQMRDAVANLKKLIEQKHIELFGTKPGALTDDQRLANIKKNAQQRIADMKAMKPRPEPRQKVKWDAEMESIANEEFRVKEKWDEEFSKARIAQLSAWQKIGRGAYLGVNFSKTIMTGMTDLGIILIQGATLPFRSASVTKQAVANMAKVILSHDEFVRQQRTINESELYRIAKKSGLDMPQVSGMEIDKLEESSLGAAGELIGDALLLPFKYVPKAGPKMYEWAKKHINVPRVLNRMQTSYLNTLRYGAFSLSARNLMDKGITFQDNPQAYKDVAEAINTMSGRTKLGAENSPAVMRALNLMFYSPKNAASVVKLYTPLVLFEIGSKRADASGWMGMSEAQQTMMRTMAGATAIPAALYLILKALTGWEEEDEEKKKREGNVTLDIENPNSSAFMKIRIGNQLFDPWGGRAQILTLQSRLMIHWWGSGRAYKDPYTGIEKKLSEVQRFKHPVGLAAEYAKGKLSPYARALLMLGTSQEVKGKKWYVRQPTDGGPDFNAWDPIKESYTNITLESMADLYGNQPLTISEIMTLFLIAGGGVTTLNNQDDRSVLSKIREKTAEGDDEKRKFAKNLSSYIKENNFQGAEEVYDEAVGITGKEKGKAEVVKKRREHAEGFFNSAKKDGVGPKYSIEKEDRKKVFDLLYKNKPIPATMKKDKKELYEKMNSFTPDEKAEIMFDYDMEYQELMNVAKGLDALNKTPNKYERKVKDVEWVKEYKRAKGIK